MRGSGETFRLFGEDVVAMSCAPRVAARGNQGKIEDRIKAAPLLPFGGSTRGFGDVSERIQLAENLKFSNFFFRSGNEPQGYPHADDQHLWMKVKDNW